MVDLVEVSGSENPATMSSTQFCEMTGREKKHINEIIKKEFVYEIVGQIIRPTLRPNGQVSDYHLPETESIMLAAKLDKSYLRKIAEFWKNRDNPSPTFALPRTFSEALRALADSEEARIVSDQKALALQEKITIDKPINDFGRAIGSSATAIKLGDFAKIIYDSHNIKLGRNRLFGWLRDNKYLASDNKPYQRFVDQGLFELRENMVTTSKRQFVTFTPLLSGKGQMYFLNKLKQPPTTGGQSCEKVNR